jgi:dihydrofolate synthase / folylpolyglutamate synthase
MVIRTIRTDKITANSIDLVSLLDATIPKLEESSIVAITSKIVSLCEGNVVSLDAVSKEELIKRESDYYLPASLSKYGHHFTIANNTLILVAGIDESNGNGVYVLWPKDAQKTANQVRAYLAKRFGLQKVGVVITDSACRPLRRGTLGIALAHSGFQALNNYVGQPDLFGKPFSVSQADVAGGLAAAAVLQMGEGAEQTPIAVLSELHLITFQDRDPSSEELEAIHISLEDDLFAPFLTAVQWQKGGRKQK